MVFEDWMRCVPEKQESPASDNQENIMIRIRLNDEEGQIPYQLKMLAGSPNANVCFQNLGHEQVLSYDVRGMQKMESLASSDSLRTLEFQRMLSDFIRDSDAHLLTLSCWSSEIGDLYVDTENHRLCGIYRFDPEKEEDPDIDSEKIWAQKVIYQYICSLLKECHDQQEWMRAFFLHQIFQSPYWKQRLMHETIDFAGNAPCTVSLEDFYF